MGYNLKTPIKYVVALAVIAVLSGVIAGVLANKVDLSLLVEYFPLIFGLLVVVNLILIGIAIRKGRIP
jgi:membrane glycosyltransferase